MNTIVRAEYIQKLLCQKCLLSDHEDRYVCKPFRKVVEDVKGYIICTNCGIKVRNGYMVVYECTSKRQEK